MRAVVLVGLMGAGKSTVGALVARSAGLPLVDVDTVIESRTGRTVRELWEGGGEAAYRHLESEVVLEAIRRGNVVLAAPGGVVLDPEVRAAVEDSFVVWLRADPTTLAGRVTEDDHRPLLGHDSLTVLTAMSRERAVLYEAMADLVVDADHDDAGAVATRIVDALADLHSSR